MYTCHHFSLGLRHWQFCCQKRWAIEHSHCSRTSDIQTLLVMDVWSCVWITKIKSIILAIKMHTNNNTVSAYHYMYMHKMS